NQLLRGHIGAYKYAKIRVRHGRSEEHTSELQSLTNLVCRLLLEKKISPRERAWVRCSPTASAMPKRAPGGSSTRRVYASFFFFYCSATPGTLPSSPPQPFSS